VIRHTARAQTSVKVGILLDTYVRKGFVANCTKAGKAYLVQVPAARGRVIPDMASISDDFPALCDPKTAMTGDVKV
jgi:hypothetical protein